MTGRRKPDWESIRPRFRQVVLRRGATRVAREIPAARGSVYRWVKGEVSPNRAAEARIRDIIEGASQ